jgi:hypothetical protein
MNPRELKLAIALAAIFLIGGGMLIFKRMGRWKQDIEKREQTLLVRKADSDALLQMQSFWEQRAVWLDEKQPPWPGNTQADSAMAALIRESAQTSGITLISRQQEPPITDPTTGMSAASVRVEVKGSMDKILRWLYGLQKNPDAFISVKGMSLSPNQEDSSVVEITNMLIQKWYRPAEVAAVEDSDAK